MARGFDPRHLTPEASLNRTRLAALPGADARWVGRPAFDLLSLRALKELEGEMGSDPESVLVSVSVLALENFGRRLAHLIATLVTHAGGGESPWREAYLRHWTQVDSIWLGGGVAAGLGPKLLDVVRPEVARLGVRDRSIELAPHAAYLPLIGAARIGLHARPTACRVVFDFGHTWVKRGIATSTQQQLARLDLLPNRPVPSTGAGHDAVGFVIDVLAETLEVAQQRFAELDPHVVVSLASYIADGRPVDSHSLYGPLGKVDLRTLEEAVRQRTGLRVRLEFVHDGTIAACGLPDPANAGLIMLGTALGSGFRVRETTLLSVSAELLVTG